MRESSHGVAEPALRIRSQGRRSRDLAAIRTRSQSCWQDNRDAPVLGLRRLTQGSVRIFGLGPAQNGRRDYDVLTLK